jgi:hypothetical protein
LGADVNTAKQIALPGAPLFKMDMFWRETPPPKADL